MQAKDIALLPDAGPLITLAYADALDLLLKPGWTVMLVDMVQHEVTRHTTPTSEKLSRWIKANRVSVRTTKTFQHYQLARASRSTQTAKPEAARKAHLGETAIQEAMNEFALLEPPKTGVFLFEDHKIARASFMVPDNGRKISTRAFLAFLEQNGAIESAAEIERRAIQAWRAFSQLRFPPL
ncbi:MAG: hypothetical protein IPH08_19305 [Rhodocyclaceae bacterium]|jgi:hypothetical protein|nr:hypothetical protein [Rhodocyclaceae bacterium]